MELTFLGTSAGSPTRHRNVSGLALHRGESWDLFDCGEATQHQIQHTSLSLTRLRRVFISHLHGDHCYGLFGLLGSRAMDGATQPLEVFGPSGLEHMVRTVLEASAAHVPYPLEFVEIDDSGRQVVVSPNETIDAVPLRHRVTSFGWWIREGPRQGLFDVARAAALGVVKGPDYGRLQRGESVVLVDGRHVEPQDVLGPDRPGRVILVAGDNSDPDALLARTGPVQLLVHEATFTEDAVAGIGDDRGFGAWRARAAEGREGQRGLAQGPAGAVGQFERR